MLSKVENVIVLLHCEFSESCQSYKEASIYTCNLYVYTLLYVCWEINSCLYSLKAFRQRFSAFAQVFSHGTSSMLIARHKQYGKVVLFFTQRLNGEAEPKLLKQIIPQNTNDLT